MANTETSRRLPIRSVLKDIDSYHGLSTIENDVTARPEGTPEMLQNPYDAMIAAQQKETALRELASLNSSKPTCQVLVWAYRPC